MWFRVNPLPHMPILGFSDSAANKDMMLKTWRNGDTIIWLSRKHCGKRRNCLWRLISPFPIMFSKAVWCWCIKMSIYGVKRFSQVPVAQLEACKIWEEVTGSNLWLGQYYFQRLMIVIATGFIPLSLLSIVLTMVMWESSQRLGEKKLCGVLVKRTQGKHE